MFLEKDSCVDRCQPMASEHAAKGDFADNVQASGLVKEDGAGMTRHAINTVILRVRCNLDRRGSAETVDRMNVYHETRFERWTTLVSWNEEYHS